MKARRILCTLQLDNVHWRRLEEAAAPGVLMRVGRHDEAGIRAALGEADTAFLHGDLDARFLSAPRLQWVHCDHAGLNKSARPEVFARGLIVTSSAGRSGPAIAEHAIFFMLALTYRFADFYEAQKRRAWGIPDQDSLRGLTGKTLGIVGFGHTGQALAEKARALGLRIVVYRRSTGPLPAGVEQAFSSSAGDTLEPLLRQSDYVVLALPLSDQTHHLMDTAAFAAMKPSAFLINVARGAVVDESALLVALQGRLIAGAGLDTFEVEPLPATSPLWEAPNVLITPHCTPQLPDRTGRSLDIICENLRRFRAGEPLLNRLMPDDVYSKGPALGDGGGR